MVLIIHTATEVLRDNFDSYFISYELFNYINCNSNFFGFSDK